MATLEEARNAQALFAGWLERHPNPDVTGYGIGRDADGKHVLAILLVTGSGRSRLPLSVGGVSTKFEVVGLIRPQSGIALDPGGPVTEIVEVAQTPGAGTAEPARQTRKAPPPPKQGPRREFLLDRMPRHRFIVIELHLKRTRGGLRPGARDAVEKFARANVLYVAKVDEQKGIAYLSATPSTLEWAFSAQDSHRNTVGPRLRMSVVRVNGERRRTVAGVPFLPDYLAPYVKYVGGFDTRPGARLMVPAKAAPPAPETPTSPVQQSAPEASMGL